MRVKEIVENLGVVYRQEGGIFQAASHTSKRLFQYVYYKSFKNADFMFDGKEYPYFYHLVNATFKSERAVEIPIAMTYLKPFIHKEVLEVGNVLNSYFRFKHDIVDKYEKEEGVINEDIIEYNPVKKYDLIVSISTLEHIGWDEGEYANSKDRHKEQGKILKALEVMRSLLKDKGKMLVTMPLGYNKELDGLIESGSLNLSKTFFLKRISRDNRWKQLDYSQIENIEYGQPYSCANAIIVGIWEK